MNRIVILSIFGAFLFAGATVSAYTGYRAGGSERGCADCHPDFEGRGTLHDMHVGNNQMTNTCLLCHTSTGDSPLTSSSGATGGEGCRGCHGVDNGPGFTWGAGLRLHHLNAGAPADFNGQICSDCHTDPAPSPESTVPVYYSRADVDVKDPCDSMTGSGEDWDADGKGLDNDGDLVYDESDSDCNPVGVVDLGLAPPPMARILAVMPNPLVMRAGEIVFGLPEPSNARLLMFDVVGRRVSLTELGTLTAGWHHIAFEARGESGRPLPSGVYLIRLESDFGVDVKRVTVLR